MHIDDAVTLTLAQREAALFDAAVVVLAVRCALRTPSGQQG